jgi:succinate-semialdehyde dehydrogenase/glutarate-semialdehyde dehydrogenase
MLSTNPAKGYARVGDVKESSAAHVRKRILVAKSAKKAWKETPLKERKRILLNVLRALQAERGSIVRLITAEMGKPRKESEKEFDVYFVKTYEHFLRNADRYLRETRVDGNTIVLEPWGVAAVILPWNYPLEMFCWGVIPNLLAGNVVVMKHSELCPLVGKTIDKAVARAKMPQGVFAQVYGGGSVGETLARGEIDFLWFTGSSRTGQHLFRIAGEKFIPSVMELGGSNPAIVFADADIPLCVKRIVQKRFENCGQSCNAIKRVLVHASVRGRFIEALRTEIAKLAVGDPMGDVDIASLASERQLRTLVGQVDDARSKGAKVLVGGDRPSGLRGAYYLPTLLTNVTASMKVWREEVFGPVLPVMAFTTQEEAVERANDTEYGLGAHVFTKSRARFRKVAAQLEAGEVHWNDSRRSYESPFGGYKHSGMGREHGEIGFRQLCQVKVVGDNE